MALQIGLSSGVNIKQRDLDHALENAKKLAQGNSEISGDIRSLWVQVKDFFHMSNSNDVLKSLVALKNLENMSDVDRAKGQTLEGALDIRKEVASHVKMLFDNVKDENKHLFHTYVQTKRVDSGPMASERYKQVTVAINNMPITKIDLPCADRNQKMNNVPQFELYHYQRTLNTKLTNESVYLDAISIDAPGEEIKVEWALPADQKWASDKAKSNTRDSFAKATLASMEEPIKQAAKSLKEALQSYPAKFDSYFVKQEHYTGEARMIIDENKFFGMDRLMGALVDYHKFLNQLSGNTVAMQLPNALPHAMDISGDINSMKSAGWETMKNANCEGLNNADLSGLLDLTDILPSMSLMGWQLCCDLENIDHNVRDLTANMINLASN